MKLQKQLSKKRGDKIYHKYIVNIPKEKIKAAGFKQGDELKAVVEKKGDMRLRKK